MTTPVLFGGIASIGLFAAADRATQSKPEPSPSAASAAEDVVVVGVRDIVVNGRARRCRPRPGDPLDQVDIRPGVDANSFMVTVPRGPDHYIAEKDMDQVTGAQFWQRAGVGMNQYVFRAPADDRPMCIGGNGTPNQFAQFRRIMDASAYRGHRLRFTVWVATSQADRVNFFLVAATNTVAPSEMKTHKRAHLRLNGGTTDDVPFGGNHGWTPVLLETGPINREAEHISYGFGLYGAGDAWFYKPRVEIISDDEAGSPAKNRIVIGQER